MAPSAFAPDRRPSALAGSVPFKRPPEYRAQWLSGAYSESAVWRPERVGTSEIESGGGSGVRRDRGRERTRAGLKAAEARGRRGGRKPVVTVEEVTTRTPTDGEGADGTVSGCTDQGRQDRALQGASAPILSRVPAPFRSSVRKMHFRVRTLKIPLIVHTGPNTSAKSGCSCSSWEKRRISGPSQSSRMVGMRS